MIAGQRDPQVLAVLARGRMKARQDDRDVACLREPAQQPVATLSTSTTSIEDSCRTSPILRPAPGPEKHVPGIAFWHEFLSLDRQS
jgi:hypothetical protein